MEYPYLGKNTYNGKDYVVFFTEEEHGVVVMSDVTDNEKLAFGKIGNFDESLFKPLEKDVCVRLQN